MVQAVWSEHPPFVYSERELRIKQHIKNFEYAQALVAEGKLSEDKSTEARTALLECIEGGA